MVRLGKNREMGLVTPSQVCLQAADVEILQNEKWRELEQVLRGSVWFCSASDRSLILVYFCKRICQSRYYCHHWEQAGSYGIESLALRKSIVVIPVILLGLPGSWRATQLFHKGKRAVIEDSEWPNGVDQASEGCLPSFHTLEYVPQGSNWIT